MPIIRVELLSGRTVDQKRDFARAITDCASKILVCSPEAVAVVFDDVVPHNWADGGVLISDKTAGKT